MLEEKIARAKKLLEQRDKIEAELASIFGLANAPKRGRPRKDQADGGGAEPAQSTAPGPTAIEP